MTVHDSECRNTLPMCLSYKPTKSTMPLSMSNLATAIKTDEALLKRDQFSANNRPKSMDITKLFIPNLSKSTSNVHR